MHGGLRQKRLCNGAHGGCEALCGIKTGFEHGGLGHAQAEELAHQGGCALQGHHVVLVEVDHRGLCGWAVLHGCRNAFGELPAVGFATGANSLQDAVLSDLKGQRRQVKHLAGLKHLRSPQAALASIAVLGWGVGEHPVRFCHLAQGPPWMALLPPGCPLSRFALRLGLGFVQAVTRWRLAGVLAIEVQSALELRNLSLHRQHLGREIKHLLLQGPQHPDQLILLRRAELGEVGQAWHQVRLSLTIS